MQASILSRTVYYDTMPDKSMYFLDWALVNTSIGAMLEPRQPWLGGNPVGTSARNLTFDSFDQLEPMSRHDFKRLHRTGGGPNIPTVYR